MNQAVKRDAFGKLRNLVDRRYLYKNVAHERQQPARGSMTHFLGWSLIIVMLCSFSLAILWPVFVLMRRSRLAAGAVLAYAAGVAGLSVVIWYVIPPVVHSLFGRVSP